MKRSIRWFGTLFCAFFVLISLQSFAVSFAANDTSSSNNTASDSVITAKIKAKLAANKATNPFNISVETNNGVVKLSGTVRSVTEASEAVRLTQETDGVVDVNADDLKLKETSNQPVADAYITAKVKGMFIREKLFGEDGLPVTAITVETKDGVVYLSGRVHKKQEASTAETLAKSITGVKKVVSTIRVGRRD